MELSNFKKEVRQHYLLTLIDIKYGCSLTELVNELRYYEEKESYTACEGIKKAIEFCKDKTIVDVTKEILSLSEPINNIYNKITK